MGGVSRAVRPSPRREVGRLHSAVSNPAMERIQRPVVFDGRGVRPSHMVSPWRHCFINGF